MEIIFIDRGEEIKVDVSENSTIRTALEAAKILPSMVIVSFEGTILPHSTVLKNSITLIVTTISSGG